MSQAMMERELARRAEGVHGAPLSLDDVRSRAVSIRRRRRAAVTGAVAAVVALVVIVPTILAGGNGPGSKAPEPAPPAPGRAAVLQDGTLTLPDGGTVALDVDNADVLQLGVLTDGRIVLATQKPYAVGIYAPDGTLDRQYPVASNAITMSATDDAVAWIGAGDTIQILLAGSSEPISLGELGYSEEVVPAIDAVIGGDRVLVGNGNVTTAEYTTSGARPLADDGFRVTDVSPDGALWAVQYADRANEQYGCAGLYDPAAAEMVARSCETAGLRFSPDGKHLLGGFFENNMAGAVSVYDLDLEQVGTFRPAGRTNVVAAASWADAEHLLVAEVDYETFEWTLAQVGLDGNGREVVVPTRTGDGPESVDEFLLSE
ncbi:hypothetical protein GCM10027062_17060 [Nocardioides hungaricus]